MNFKKFLAEMASLRSILKPVPQSKIHHPESDVSNHTQLVHKSLSTALNLLKQAQKDEPNGPFSNLNFDLTSDENKLIRIAALLHDIGKKTATEISPEGKITAYAHDEPFKFEPAMKMLGYPWTKMYANASQEDKDDLWFLIQNHMQLKEKMSKRLEPILINPDGKYKNDRRTKLLIVLLMMDRIGRGEIDLTKPFRQTAKEFVKSNVEDAKKGISGLYKSSENILKQNTPKKTAIDDPDKFVQMLRNQGKPEELIRKIFKSKFGRELT